jgi:hypothetical protein
MEKVRGVMQSKDIMSSAFPKEMDFHKDVVGDILHLSDSFSSV